MISDVILDLVQILEEAADSGRLVGGDDSTLDTVEAEERDSILLTLSDGTKVRLRVRETV